MDWAHGLSWQGRLIVVAVQPRRIRIGVLLWVAAVTIVVFGRPEYNINTAAIHACPRPAMPVMT